MWPRRCAVPRPLFWPLPEERESSDHDVLQHSVAKAAPVEKRGAARVEEMTLERHHIKGVVHRAVKAQRLLLARLETVEDQGE